MKRVPFPLERYPPNVVNEEGRTFGMSDPSSNSLKGGRCPESAFERASLPSVVALVEEYSRRSISCPGDKLRAVRGLARMPCIGRCLVLGLSQRVDQARGNRIPVDLPKLALGNCCGACVLGRLATLSGSTRYYPWGSRRDGNTGTPLGSGTSLWQGW